MGRRIIPGLFRFIPRCARGTRALTPAVFLAGIGVSIAGADVPRLIQYQGKLLTDTGTALTGSVDIRVRLYNDPTATMPVLFDEIHPAIQLNRGLFSILVGSRTVGGVPDAAVSPPQLYMGVSIDGDAELSPRRRIVTAPYAVKARDAERLVRPGTLDSEVSVDAAGGVAIGAAGADPSAKLEVSSTTSGFLPPRVTTAQRDAISSPANGLVVFNTETGCLEFFVGSIWQRAACGCTAAPAMPDPISGPALFFPFQANVAYSVPPVFGADSYTWSVPPGASIVSGAGTPSILVTFGNTGGSITAVAVNGCGSSPDRTLSVSLQYHATCQAIKTAQPASTDGTYTIDPDGAGGFAPMSAYCDMTTDGGGWTLVLNYLHQGGTNPSLQVRSGDLPLQNSTTLGTNENGTPYWGHASASVLNAVPFTQVRFYGRTTNHSRIIHFRSGHAGTVSYFKSGSGSCSGIQSSFTALSGHNANLPGVAGHFVTSAGDYAMADHPFYLSSTYHWLLSPGGTGRWEVDDYYSGGNGASNHTHHQTWVK